MRLLAVALLSCALCIAADGVPTPTTLWTVHHNSGAVNVGPTQIGSVVVYGTISGDLYAVSHSSGQLLWKTQLSELQGAKRPSVQGPYAGTRGSGAVVALVAGGSAFGVSLASGAPQYRLRGNSSTTFHFVGDYIAALHSGQSSCTVTQVSLESGRQVDSYASSQGCYRSAVAATQPYVAFSPKFSSPLVVLRLSSQGIAKLYELSPKTANLGHWSVSRAHFVGRGDQYLVVVATDSFGSDGFFAYDTASGAELWHEDTGGDLVAYEGNTGVITTFDYSRGQRYAQRGIDLGTSQKLWSALPMPLPDVPVEQGGAKNGYFYVLLGDCTGGDIQFYVLDLSTGKTLLQFSDPVGCNTQYDQPAFNVPIVTTDAVYFINKASLSAIDIATGTHFYNDTFNPTFLTTDASQKSLYAASNGAVMRLDLC